MPCTPEEEGTLRCFCGEAGLMQYVCTSGEWVSTGTECNMECEAYDIPCHLQNIIWDEMGECLDWNWALAITAGLGGLVFGFLLVSRR